jgi:hypothetical protein
MGGKLHALDSGPVDEGEMVRVRRVVRQLYGL